MNTNPSMSKLFPSMSKLFEHLQSLDAGTLTPNIRKDSVGRGFHYQCLNDWSVSVQWHDYAYCAIRHQDDHGPRDCQDSEVAVYNADGEMVYLCAYDQVLGWQSPDEVLALIDKVGTSPDWGTEPPQSYDVAAEVLRYLGTEPPQRDEE